MDTTPKYILMCEEAKKIQKEWKPKEGDFLSIKPSRDKALKFRHQEEVTLVISDEFIIQPSHIWLPRQDQFQKMAGRMSFLVLLDDFHDFLNSDYYNKKCPAFCFDSIEQLWLGFVMKEKYSKVWNGKDWIKK